MKVLFLTPWYPDDKTPNHGIFVRDQAVAISKQHEILVISAKIDKSQFAFSSLNQEEVVFKNVRETRLRVKRSLPVFNQLNFFIRTVSRTVAIGRQFQPDVIHSNIGYPGGFWGLMASRILGVPLVITEHTRLSNNFRSFIHRYLTLFSLRRAKAVLAVSHWHARDISCLSDVQTTVVHNVVDFSKYPGTLLRPVGNLSIGFLGGLNTPVKGLDMLLKASALLNGDFTLHIGGAGSLIDEYRTTAEQLNIAHKCKFYGSIPHENVIDFMRNLHFFVSASRSETFGIAIVEALACGLPVVATDSGGPRDFITKQNGILVPATVEGLTFGMQQMINNYRDYDPQEIRNSVIERFSDTQFLNAINAVYTQVQVKNSH